MSFRTNVAASYASQIYVSLIGIAMLPTYMKYMGTEAYGLVGFFAVVQAWFQLLDLGLPAALSREVARAGVGRPHSAEPRSVLRAMEAFYAAVALLGVGLFQWGADWIGSHWLRVEGLPQDEVRSALALMGTAVVLRWVAGLYRSAINGLEQQVWLGGMNAATATARYVLILPVFVFIGTSPTVFFGYQVVVGLAEAILLAFRTYRALPPSTLHTRGQAMHHSGHIALLIAIAASGSLWVIVTQSDKLLLSKLPPLSEFAHFTLAVVVASGITMITSPISTVLLPRLSRLHAERKDGELVSTYRLCTQAVGIVAFPITATLALLPEQLLWAWTGDPAIARGAATVLRWYALGNGLLAVSAFPYYLQYAHGRLRLHLIGSSLFALVLLPTVWLGALKLGSSGAAMAWLATNLVYALIWVPVIHRQLVPGMHLRWALHDVLAIATPPIFAAALFAACFQWPASRVGTAVVVILFTVGNVGVAAMASPTARSRVRRLLLDARSA